ncbi:glycosyltransferase 87 family protein [Tomitella gaofuii]|uniref:glycosyltransferase 87 family protein n=1 Tax=Tomitella gaofuii TaxID=2760083 RepID=UPI0015FA8D42|nr:glycosyltransferase 87 family protein [Tomitella gaofuii]
MTWRGRWFAVAACAAAITVLFRLVDTVHGIDLRVYFEAGRSVLAGNGLYGGPQGAARVPFTYPPFAALAAVPLAATGWSAAQWLWAIVNVCALSVAVAVGYRAVLAGRRRRTWWLLGLTGCWAASGPVADHLGYGQVGLLLMAVCLVDADRAVRLPAWLPRGVLTGCAAAVKLIPAAYLAVPLLRRRWRTAAVGAAAAIACTLLALAVLPGPTRAYVVDVVPGLADRVGVGDPAVAGNQSLRGMLLRTLPADASDRTVLASWAAACLLLVPLTVWGALRAARSRGTVAALVVVALGVEMMLPVAWTHHYVWLVPAVGLLWSPPRSAESGGSTGVRAARVLAAAVTIAAFARTAPLVATGGTGVAVLDRLGTEAIIIAAAAAMIGLAAPGGPRKRAAGERRARAREVRDGRPHAR